MEKNKKISVIIAGAGSSNRLKSNISKQFVELDSKPLLYYSLEKFSKFTGINEVIIVSDDIKHSQELIDAYRITLPYEVKVVQGGSLRQESVYLGFQQLNPSVDLVIVHDVARPLFDIEDLKRCIECALRSGASILVIPLVDTIKKGVTKEDRVLVENTIKRDDLYAVQTPQVFAYSLLKEAYVKYNEMTKKSVVTDEASLVELLGREVDLVIGKRSNIKITYPEDLELAEAILKSKMYEVGSKR